MTKLDDTDREIISILRADARTPVATLAQKLRVSRGTVQNRLHKMEESGVITGYTVRLRPDSEPQRIRAWMSIAVEGNAAPAVIRALRGEPTVGTLHTTNARHWQHRNQYLVVHLQGVMRPWRCTSARAARWRLGDSG